VRGPSLATFGGAWQHVVTCGLHEDFFITQTEEMGTLIFTDPPMLFLTD
jgi:hypothetical protein